MPASSSSASHPLHNQENRPPAPSLRLDPPPNISPSYIHTVQHLIEKCLLFAMDREECVDALTKHARVDPLVTQTVWKELEKANPKFFAAYHRSRLHAHRRSSADEALVKALAEVDLALEA